MSDSHLIKEIQKNKLPVVVDIWAPWCIPCRTISPMIEKLGKEYIRRVDILKINAEEHPTIVQELKIHSIPTLIIFHQGEEIGRNIGATDYSGLQQLFEAAVSGTVQEWSMPRTDRYLRIGAGAAVGLIGWFSGPSWILLGAGGLIIFAGLYDRCPLLKMIGPRIKSILQAAL